MDIELFLRHNGWSNADLSWDQFIPAPNSISKHHQDLDLAKNIRWIFQRYHIRLWDLGEVEGIVIGSVHLDYTRSKGHESADFESIERDFSDMCRQNTNITSQSVVVAREINTGLTGSFSSYHEWERDSRSIL